MRNATIILLALCCAVGCRKTTSISVEQQALQSALIDYFSAQHWQDKQCYLKKNEFTVQSEYPLAQGQTPAKVIDLADQNTLAKGRTFGSEWTIIRCIRE